MAFSEREIEERLKERLRIRAERYAVGDGDLAVDVVPEVSLSADMTQLEGGYVACWLWVRLEEEDMKWVYGEEPVSKS